jgi:hypothetical protein
MDFDPDVLLEALPRRQINQLSGVRFKVSGLAAPAGSALGHKGEYNGFTATERNRTARLSNRLAELGATSPATVCDICGASADDEHAENYYDLTTWIGLCRACHRNALHKRFSNPRRWAELLDKHEVPDAHWARLVSPAPFDLAELLRSRGVREPTMAAFV